MSVKRGTLFPFGTFSMIFALATVKRLYLEPCLKAARRTS